VVETWIADQDLEVTGYEIDADEIELSVAGPEVPQGVEELAAELARTLGRDVDLTVVYVPRFRVQAAADG
jgi:hypothetical protein